MKSLVLSILALMAAVVFLSPQAKADEWNKKTVVTFSEPVEIPGRVLPAGTYVFKLADTMADRNVVQVFNKDENHLYGTFLAIPDYRMKTPDKVIITFNERAAGAPQAIKAWFYPGDNYGDEFVYPKSRASELAKLNHENVPAMPTELANNTQQPVTSPQEAPVTQMEQSQVTVQQPEGSEQQLSEAYPPPTSDNSASTSSSTDNSASRSASTTPSELPKTGSELPLIGLIGLISLGAGWTLRAAARHIG